MKENNENTIRRINNLCEILKVDIKWECEINRELKENKMMAEFFSDLGNDKGPIDPRDAYYGGRTGFDFYSIFSFVFILGPYVYMKNRMKIGLYLCLI
jgi:hypothetical protein